MNYYDTFILIAPDSTATRGTAPPLRDGAPSIPAIEFALLSAEPYGYTQEELLFAVHLQRDGISPAEAKEKHKELWPQFFSKSRACLRSSEEVWLGLPLRHQRQKRARCQDACGSHYRPAG